MQPEKIEQLSPSEYICNGRVIMHKWHCFSDFNFRYYRERSRCEKCHHSCTVCMGPGPQSCRACSPPLLELRGTKVCVEYCPKHFYQIDDMCAQCHTSCQTCSGAEPNTITGFHYTANNRQGHTPKSTHLYQYDSLVMCVCRCLASELFDMWSWKYSKGQSLLSSLRGGDLLFRKGVFWSK